MYDGPPRPSGLYDGPPRPSVSNFVVYSTASEGHRTGFETNASVTDWNPADYSKTCFRGDEGFADRALP